MTEVQYRPGSSVRVRVVRRGDRIVVSDEGAAVAAAGYVDGWREAARRVETELVVNISRHGVIWLPVVRIGPSEPVVVERIARASQALYQEILDGSGPRPAAARTRPTACRRLGPRGQGARRRAGAWSAGSYSDS